MSYRVELSEAYKKAAKEIDKGAEMLILKWLNKNIEGSSNPRAFGKPLKGNLKNYWHYRIGNYRVIVDIQEDKLVILAINVGHRKSIYKTQDT